MFHSGKGQVKTSETAPPPPLSPVKIINENQYNSGNNGSPTPKTQKDAGMVVPLIS